MIRALICLVFLSAIGAVPGTLGADVVHLTNGRSMEGVVLEETSEQITLQLPFGEIRLPRSSVRFVEPGRSSLQEYLDRRAALEESASGAAAWLELAQWAERQGLDHSAREAVLVAARLDPGLQGLGPMMTDLGYEYEENLALWLPHDEFMHRRGFVQANGRWLSPEQAVAAERARQAVAYTAAERQRRDRLARALEMMAVAQMARAEEDRRRREQATAIPEGIPLWGGYPVLVAPGYWPRLPLRPTPHHRDGYHRGPSSARSRDRDAIVARPPGSLIPVTPIRSHRGGIQKPSHPE